MADHFKHTFNVLFRRNAYADLALIEDRIEKQKHDFTAAAIQQFESELYQIEWFVGKCQFSKVLTYCGESYYILAKITFYGPINEVEALDKLHAELAKAYVLGMDGHYGIIPESHQYKLRQLERDTKMPLCHFAKFAPIYLTNDASD